MSYLAPPPAQIFTWPSHIELPPGPPAGTPFGRYYAFFMDSRVPVAIALAYATTVHVINHIRQTNKKSLPICNTAAFKWVVLAHNIGLSVYSAWTFVGVTTVIVASFRQATRLNLTAGNALWRTLCDVEDGVWSNGLAYYGYLFYLSKFYEVFDTLIILAKGRQSSLLQTYHHAGSMLSMWAGVRTAAPPIWVFVAFNSLIHALMYFHYTLSALKVPVPAILKQSLTSLQIGQFVFGSLLACAHMFAYYLTSKGRYRACLDSPGKFYALVFNLSFLAPLTYLFVNFWIGSYVAAKKKQAAVRKATAHYRQPRQPLPPPSSQMQSQLLSMRLKQDSVQAPLLSRTT